MTNGFKPAAGKVVKCMRDLQAQLVGLSQMAFSLGGFGYPQARTPTIGSKRLAHEI